MLVEIYRKSNTNNYEIQLDDISIANISINSSGKIVEVVNKDGKNIECYNDLYDNTYMFNYTIYNTCICVFR